MIDDAVILVSTIMCLVIVFRAIRMDGQLPWFHVARGKRRTAAPDAEPDDVS